MTLCHIVLFRPGTSGADVLLALDTSGHWGIFSTALTAQDDPEVLAHLVVREQAGLWCAIRGHEVRNEAVLVWGWMADWDASATFRAAGGHAALFWYPYESMRQVLPAEMHADMAPVIARAWELFASSGYS